MTEVILSFFRLIKEVILKCKKNIHLVCDDKFIDFAIREFNEAGNQKHLFVLIGTVQKLKFIKSTEVLIIHPRLFWYLVPYTKGHVNSFFFHSLPDGFYKNIIHRIPKGIPLIWMSWGYDLIAVFGDAMNYVKPRTKNIISINNLVSHQKHTVLTYFQAFTGIPDVRKIVERMDYFSTVIEEEKKIIDSNLFHKVPSWFPWNYFTMEQDVINGFEDKEVTGNNILIGNSGNFWNNHLDAFADLLEFQIEFDKIICPLSYGDQNYSSIVLKEGKSIFGERLIFLTDFLEYPDYVRQLFSCKFFFMNSLRQLGLGNLLLLLYLGSYVILDKSNPVFGFFSKNDIKVFSIEDAKFGNFQPIDLVKTRSNLIRIWGKETIRRKTHQIIELIS